MTENSETKIANLLASMNNLPQSDFDAKIAVLTEIIEEQQKIWNRLEDLENAFLELPEIFELKEKMLTVDEIKGQKGV